jgi:hypothetical protein
MGMIALYPCVLRRVIPAPRELKELIAALALTVEIERVIRVLISKSGQIR